MSNQKMSNMGRYKSVVVKGHPYAKNASSHVYVHRLVVEKAIGKYLHPRHPVHHINGDKHDNRPENLVACEDRAYHHLIHVRQDAMRACGNPSWRMCTFCLVHDSPDLMIKRMNKNKTGCSFHHRACRNLAANMKYAARKNDPEFVNKKRAWSRRAAATYRAKKKAEAE